jgi:hypothetical protein
VTAKGQTVGLNIGPGAREAVRALTYRLTGEAGRRVTMTEAITAACSVASRDLAATVAALTESDAKDRS